MFRGYVSWVCFGRLFASYFGAAPNFTQTHGDVVKRSHERRMTIGWKTTKLIFQQLEKRCPWSFGARRERPAHIE